MHLPSLTSCQSYVAAFALSVVATFTVSGVNLQWDANPTSPPAQDGNGNWANAASNTNWWDGAQDVAWSPGATAIFGANTATNYIVTIVDNVFAGGLILSNITPSAAGLGVYTFNPYGSASLALGGSPALLRSAVHHGTVAVIDPFTVSLVATGGLQIVAETTYDAQVRLGSTSNYVVGSLSVGTPGNASYTSPTAMFVDVNNANGANALSATTNLTIYSNACILFRGPSAAYTLNWPKAITVSGDGIPNATFFPGAVEFAGSASGVVVPMPITVAGDSTLVYFSDSSISFTCNGPISGSGRLRLSNASQRTGSTSVLMRTNHSYVGDTLFTGRLTVQLAGGADNRFPPATVLMLGSSGSAQTSWDGYGRLVLGDPVGGAANQTLAGLTNDSLSSANCWVAGGNASANSILTINNARDYTYTGRLGGSGSPDKMLGLVKTGPGTLYLQGTNLCAAGYTVNAGVLVLGGGPVDYPLSGPITNNAALMISVASGLTYSDPIAGAGLFTKGGPGTLTLNGTNAVTGPVLVQSGKLALSPGTVMAGPLVVPSAELQINRSAAAVTLSVASASFANATLDLDLDFNPAGPVVLNVSGALTNNGVTKINLLRAGALGAGRYPLIQYGSYQGDESSPFVLNPLAPGMAATIQNNPANGSIDLVVTAAPSISASLVGSGALELSWPPDNTGWQLQMQTNSLAVGLSTNWFIVADSTLTNLLWLPIDPTVGTTFFRLVYPPEEVPIFANTAFRFFPDRMEAFDVYQGVYRSSDGLTLTKDGDPTYTWANARLDRLYLQSAFPILDATFALAVDALFRVRAPAGTTSAQLGGDQPGGQYYVPYFYFTHGTDIREYTRDSAQHIQWGDSVILDPQATRGSLIRRCDFANRLIREDAVTTADSVHFISAAWEYFKITGDTNLLLTCWACMSNTITSKEATQKDLSDGLWTGSPWSDNVTGFVTQQEFNTRQTAVKSLYGNLMVAMAWRDLGQIAATLVHTNEVAQYSQKCAASKAAINAKLYRPEYGTYCYYEYQPSGTNYNYREDMSAGLLYLADVADAAHCLDYHSRFKATLYGYRNVDPVLPSGATSYHGGNVWENQEAYHGWALARLGQPELLEPFIFWHARSGLPLKGWQEGTIDPSTGQFHTNYTRMAWGAMGYISYWTRGVFGVIYQPDGLAFAPCVPHSFGDNFHAVLNNFNYRNSQLRLILTGCGTSLESLLLDGVAVSGIPAAVSGAHTVELRMSATHN
jgi:autotransporter-associated beta strand protein